MHVQSLAGQPVANVSVLTSGMVQPDRDWLARRLGILVTYERNVLVTDTAGNATLWLFPNNDPPSWGLYTITAAPPDGSDVVTTNLPNIAVHGDMAVTITLAAPVTLRGRILDGLGMPLANQYVR